MAKVKKQLDNEIIETGKRTAIDLGIHGLHPELIRIVGKMKYRSSYGQNLLQHARETANLCAVMAAELGLNPKKAKRAGLLHDIGKVPDERELAAKLNTRNRLNLITATIPKYLADEMNCRALCFCINIEHARTTAEGLREAGYRADTLTGQDSEDRNLVGVERRDREV